MRSATKWPPVALSLLLGCGGNAPERIGESPLDGGNDATASAGSMASGSSGSSVSSGTTGSSGGAGSSSGSASGGASGVAGASGGSGSATTGGSGTASGSGSASGSASGSGSNSGGASSGCTGVCAQVPACDGATTFLGGVVMDPGGINPIFNARVYIPNDPTDPALTSPLTDGAACGACGAALAGSPLVETRTSADGTFSMSGVPVGNDLTLVVQIGRWRRLFHVNVANACSPNMVVGTGAGGAMIQAGVLTLPKNQSEGDIPRSVIVTGDEDALECVLWKIGVDQGEFTNPGGSGRIHLVTGSGHDVTTGVAPPGRTNDRAWVNTCTNGPADVPCTAACPGSTCTLNRYGGGAVIDPNTPSEMVLFQNNGPAMAPLANYDMAFLACQGWPWADAVSLPSLAHVQELVSYANGGGHVFANHFASEYYRYATAAGPNPFGSTATWGTASAVAFNPDLVTGKQGFVDVNPAENSQGNIFATWLAHRGVLITTQRNSPTVLIGQAKWDTAFVFPPTRQWMFMSPPDNNMNFVPLLFTFDTPIGAAPAAQCGRGLYADFHVTTYSTSGSGGALQGNHGRVFPLECGPRSPMTAEEDIFEYMLFDASCTP